LGHKKRRIKPSSYHPDRMPIANTPAAEVTGSEKRRAPAKPPGRPAERKTGRRPRWLRYLFWAGAIVAVVVVVLRIILWLFLPWILNKTMAQYGLEARYERLSLSLLTGDAELWHLVLAPSDANTPLADVEYCRADVSLVTLLTRRLVVHRIEIDGMDVNLTRAQDGTFPQLRTLFAVLRERSDAAQHIGVEAAPTSVSPREIDLTPPLKMDALRLQHVQVRFRDETVAPVFETQLDLNVRLSDLRSDKRKTRFQVILSSPPVLDQLRIEGTGSAGGRDLLAEVKVALQGLHPVVMEDYLADLGFIPDARNLALACTGSVRVQGAQVTEANDVDPLVRQPLAPGEAGTSPLPPTLQVHFESKNATMTIDGMEHFALEHAVVDANLSDSGAVRVGLIQARGGAVHAWKKATGLLSVGGLQFVGRAQRRPTAKKGVARPADSVDRGSRSASPSPSESTARWSLDVVEVRDVRLVLHDQSVSPQADLVLDLNEVTVEDAPSRLNGLTLTARLGAPGIMDSLQAKGTMVLSSSESAAALKISGTGIRLDTLQPHLGELGLESLYEDGTFSCDVNATFSQADGEPFNASASIANISLRDTEELFGLKTIGAQGMRIDPNSGVTRIDQVNISGQRLALGRDETGCLTVLGFRLIGSSSEPRSQQAAASTQPVAPQSGNMDALRDAGAAPAGRRVARIEIGRLSWYDNELTFVDRMVTPAKTIAVPDLGFELTNLVLGAESGSVSPASVKAWLRSPGTFERVELSGSIAPEQAGLSFDLSLRGEGMALAGITPYLQTLGTESTMTEGSISAQTKGHVAWGDKGIQCSGTIRDAAIKDGTAELAALNQIEVERLNLGDAGFQVERVTIEQPRVTLAREESGVLACAGLRMLPGQETTSEPTQAEPTKWQPAMPVRVGRLEVKEARIQWSDRAVVPTVSQAMAIDLALSGFALGVEAPPATMTATVCAPGMVQQATVSGQVQVTPSKQGADLTLEAAGVNVRSLLSYLPPGAKPALEEGRLHARIAGELTRHPEGGRRARVSVTGLDYGENSGEEPFLRFDSAELAVERFDPNAQLISIQQVSLQGLEATVERKASGTMSLLGFDIWASEPVAGGHPSPADEQPSSANSATDVQPATELTAPDGKPGRMNGVARKAQRLPLVILDQLSLEARKLTVKDGTRPMATPIVVSDLQIGNTEGIRVLGDEPDANPPIKIDISGQIQPLTKSLLLKLEMSPFAAQPQILAEWDITQIRGSGLTSVVPELRTVVDANGLRNGRFSGTAQLTLRLDRRNVAEFNFSRPLGLDLLCKAATFGNAETDAVLAGVDELRIAVPRLDPKSGSVHVKEIGLVKPRGAISREADGLHLLGMVLKTMAPGTTADADAVAASPATNVDDAQTRRAEDSSEQGKQLDLRVDQFLVNGVDFRFVDNTVDPPMYFPLKGLDVEVRGFATPGAEAKGPVRFNVVAVAGEVSLLRTERDSASAAEVPPEDSVQDSPKPSTAENRLLFQEMLATARLTLYPRPEGWVKAGMSGLELVNFEGVAKQKGMTLRDGILDASVDIRFRQDQPLSTRARLVFTDLSLTEPPDGFLAQLLTLPTSLDTVIFILQDAGGSIRLPLSFEIAEEGLSRGQVTRAAVGAAAALIAGAVAGSPFRVAGTIGNVLGGEQEEATGAETHVVQFAPAVTTLSADQTAELAEIRERLRRERDLFVTVRHHLGGGDIEQANGLINLSSMETRELLAKLRQERTELQQVRDELAGQTRAAYVAGTRENVIDRTRRLQATETQLGLIERAVDDLLETMRPGSEYAARRRTRDACLAIGKTRLYTLCAFLADAEIPDGAERIALVPPRFTEAGNSAGGSITLTLSKSKAR